MDDVEVVRRALAGAEPKVVLAPRPLETYIDAFDDWTRLVVELQRGRLHGEVSRQVILPPEQRDMSMFILASLVRQISEANERGATELEFAISVEGELLLQTARAIRTFAYFIRAIAETGQLGHEARESTLALVDSIADELARYTAAE